MWATKYRPKTFDDVVGQSEAIKILKSSIGNSTTFILHGASGVGKTTLARIFAESINGEAIEINGSDNNGVDDVRALISSATYIPAFNDYRVFIIDECHMLSAAAWNALLKILEESPKTTLWVLCTTEYAKIPATIKSRSTTIKLNRIATSEIVKVLNKIAYDEGADVGEDYKQEVVERIAQWSEGRLREAIVQFETYMNSGVVQLPYSSLDVIELLTDVFQGKSLSAIDKIDHLTNEDVYVIIRFLNDYIKLLLLRNELPRTVSTASILDNYTSISSSHIEDLRKLQDEIWQRATPAQEQWRGSVDLIYNLYDKITKHYNDFRDGRLAVSMALLHTMGGTSE